VAKGAPVADPWRAADLLPPAETAAWLADAKRPGPVIVHVGFDFLYRAGHIPGALYLGAGLVLEGSWNLTPVARFLV
jgi:hypothetical protein